MAFCSHCFPSLLTHLLNMFLSKLGNSHEIKKNFCPLAFSPCFISGPWKNVDKWWGSINIFYLLCWPQHFEDDGESESEVARSFPTLCDPMDCSLPGSSVHGIFQAIVLEWVAISFSSGSSPPRDGIQVSRVVDRRFTIWATKEDDGMKSLFLFLGCLLLIHFFKPFFESSYCSVC